MSSSLVLITPKQKPVGTPSQDQTLPFLETSPMPQVSLADPGGACWWHCSDHHPGRQVTAWFSLRPNCQPCLLQCTVVLPLRLDHKSKHEFGSKERPKQRLETWDTLRTLRSERPVIQPVWGILKPLFDLISKCYIQWCFHGMSGAPSLRLASSAVDLWQDHQHVQPAERHRAMNVNGMFTCSRAKKR